MNKDKKKLIDDYYTVLDAAFEAYDAALKDARDAAAYDAADADLEVRVAVAYAAYYADVLAGESPEDKDNS